MPSAALQLALDTVAVGLAVLRARTPGTPPGDADDQHEDNTFSLPNGNPIRRAFKRFAKRQLKKILGTLPTIGAPLPQHFPLIAPDWTDPMASAITPLISAYWDEAGKTTRARLGLDPDQWEVHDPHLHQMIRQSTLKFCRTTNETTDLDLAEALDRLRDELAAGLVEHGESIPELAARVRSVFSRLSGYRAEMIARTEASRAVHAASQESAKESGVVQGKRWLISANSCDKCVAVAKQVNESHPKGLPLDQPFAQEQSKQEEYASVPHPPLHPHCRCSITFVLTDEYEELLAQHGPGAPKIEPGALGPEPKPKRERKPRAPKPAVAAEAAWEVGTPIEPTKPIGERIAKAKHLEEKRLAVLDVAAKAAHEEAALKESLRDARQRIAAIVSPAMKAGKKYEDIRPLVEPINREEQEIIDRLGKLRDTVKVRVSPLLDLAADRRADWTNKDGAGSWRTTNGTTRQGVTDWLSAKVAKGPLASPVEITWNAKPNARAFASRHDSSITVKVRESAGTMVHEMGHHVEYRLPGAQKAAQDFLAHRVGSQPLVSLRKQLGGGYRSSEQGRDDDFAKAFGSRDAWYVGKHYAHGTTEIISMGIEMVYNDPVGFAEKDPEYFKFILGILDGSMRTP